MGEALPERGTNRVRGWRHSQPPRQNADVAQLVEQLIRNQQVAGSSPAVSSIAQVSIPTT
jgi:hypothetical protein